ncbi:MAG: translation initiation factor IF-2 N-terminal domain-containing protein, partial [Kiritimatiellae bacterium]|nr:translation initiation factor IF-2 N-terminal domain-containing protein [Kiritimatiellia bacterium]
MRVYELAKAAGVTSADVLRAAEGCGAEVTNAISVIEAGELAALKSAVKDEARRSMRVSSYT